MGVSSVVTMEATSGPVGTPWWLSVVLTVITLMGVIVSAGLLRRTGKEARTSAEELDRRGKREETMRTLRWAAEKAVSTVQSESMLGTSVLGALGDDPWLEEQDQRVIDAAIGAVTREAADALVRVGLDAEAVQVRYRDGVDNGDDSGRREQHGQRRGRDES